MAGNLTTSNTFATQVGQVPAAQLDANWTQHAAYINAREITLGTLAARPSASVSGRLYVATDVNGGTLYEDNGSAWTQIAPGVSSAITTPVSTANGGTGAAGLTSNAVLVGTGPTTSVTLISMATSGALLVGQNTAPPVALTVGANSQILIADNTVTPGVRWGALGDAFTAPVTISDATAGGTTHPFLRYQKTGSQTWITYWQKPANFGGVGGVGSETLSIGTSNPATGLQLHLIADPGGQRLAVWDPSNALPNIPHTGILPTMAVYGDVLVGDIVALESNPMTYFIRANTNILHTAVTQLFSARRAAGTEPDSGATLVFAPMKNGGGAVSDGYIRLEAYGGGSGADANEIQLRQRSASNTIVNRWAVGGTGVFYPKDSNGTLDVGTAGNRIRALFANSNIFVGSGGDPLPKGRIQFCDAGGITAGNTVFYGPWATNGTETNVFVQHLMPFSGVLRNFFAKMTTAPGAGQDYKYTIRVNATSSTIVATMSGVATTASDVTNSVAVNKGDYVTLQVTASTGAAGGTGAAAIEIDPV